MSLPLVTCSLLLRMVHCYVFSMPGHASVVKHGCLDMPYLKRDGQARFLGVGRRGNPSALVHPQARESVPGRAGCARIQAAGPKPCRSSGSGSTASCLLAPWPCSVKSVFEIPTLSRTSVGGSSTSSAGWATWKPEWMSLWPPGMIRCLTTNRSLPAPWRPRRVRAHNTACPRCG